MSPAEARAPNASVRRPGPLRVLVVDDEPDTVITLLAILREEGYEAKGFAHPLEALRDLNDFDPDVVISDIAMPVVSGWDFARKVRQKMGEIRPMLIAVSGVYQKSSDKLLATMAGYEFFLSKPCDPGVLVAIVEKARGGGEL
jgi:DNA-binding response OmpR family regulator